MTDLIKNAYQVEFYQIDGGPQWITTQWYDVEARANGPADTQQIPQMLQTLLADAFI